MSRYKEQTELGFSSVKRRLSKDSNEDLGLNRFVRKLDSRGIKENYISSKQELYSVYI